MNLLKLGLKMQAKLLAVLHYALSIILPLAPEKTSELKMQARFWAIVFCALGITLPVALKETNILCQSTTSVMAFFACLLITKLFRREFGYWPWQKEKRHSS